MAKEKIESGYVNAGRKMLERAKSHISDLNIPLRYWLDLERELSLIEKRVRL